MVAERLEDILNSDVNGWGGEIGEQIHDANDSVFFVVDVRVATKEIHCSLVTSARKLVSDGQVFFVIVRVARRLVRGD